MGNEIERIESILEDACKEMEKSSNVFWPYESEIEDIHESNLCLYIGHSFLKAGYFVYTEVHPPEERIKIDLLAGKENVRIYLEAKNLSRPGTVREIIADLNRLNSNYFPEDKNLQRYGIIAISSWLRKHHEWWENMNEDFKIPKGDSSPDYEELAKLVLKKVKNGAIKGKKKITDQTKDGSEWYLLYLIFPLQ